MILKIAVSSLREISLYEAAVVIFKGFVGNIGSLVVFFSVSGFCILKHSPINGVTLF